MKSCYRLPWLTVTVLGLIVLLILGFLFQWKALVSLLPWLFVLACPLMHLFHGHGGHEHSRKEKTR